MNLNATVQAGSRPNALALAEGHVARLRAEPWYAVIAEPYPLRLATPPADDSSARLAELGAVGRRFVFRLAALAALRLYLHRWAALPEQFRMIGPKLIVGAGVAWRAERQQVRQLVRHAPIIEQIERANVMHLQPLAGLAAMLAGVMVTPERPRSSSMPVGASKAHTLSISEGYGLWK